MVDIWLPSSATNRSLSVQGVGTFQVDTAYGGDSFVIVSSDQLPHDITPGNARLLADIGTVTTRAANEQIGFRHPGIEDFDHISFCLFADPVQEDSDHLVTRHAVAIRPGKIDRSPTGTGVSAHMALLHARGEMRAGGRLLARSIIGSTFIGRIESITTVAGQFLSCKSGTRTSPMLRFSFADVALYDVRRHEELRNAP